MSMNDFLLICSAIIIIGLLGVIVYLSRRKVTDNTAEGNNQIRAQPTEIHAPGPRLQPELGVATSEPPQYQRREYFFSYQERKFYDVLRQVLQGLDENLQIFAKVRMADIVNLVNEPKDKGRYINYILTRHIDFLVCDMRYQKPLFGIELNDSSHMLYDRQESDKFKQSVFDQVNLPLLPFDVKTYTWAEVENRIREALAVQGPNRPS